MSLSNLTNKRIIRIERSMYNDTLTIYLDDGTKLQLYAGRNSIHNDSWATVEYRILN